MTIPDVFKRIEIEEPMVQTAHLFVVHGHARLSMLKPQSGGYYQTHFYDLEVDDLLRLQNQAGRALYQLYHTKDAK